MGKEVQDHITTMGCKGLDPVLTSETSPEVYLTHYNHLGFENNQCGVPAESQQIPAIGASQEPGRHKPGSCKRTSVCWSYSVLGSSTEFVLPSTSLGPPGWHLEKIWCSEKLFLPRSRLFWTPAVAFSPSSWKCPVIKILSGNVLNIYAPMLPRW